MHFLYPEGERALERIKDAPAHRFFKTFGEAMPEGDWRHPGTKQGVYMIGPNAEYLEGGGAISGNARRVRRRLKRALERWARLRREKGYANEVVPRVETAPPPEVAGKPLVLRVFLRDLPRGPRDDSGRRFGRSDLRGPWPAFTEWAWNVNWIAFEDPRAFVPAGGGSEPVADAVVQRLCRRVLVDNVRGQTPGWRKEHVEEARLTMRRVAVADGRWIIEYEGSARMRSERQGFTPKLHGRGRWDPEAGRLEALELLAIGERTGKGTFNQRDRDPGPAPMGIALVLHR